MRLSDRVRAILDATVRVYQSDPVYGQRPDVAYQLHHIGMRLNAPLRIALAGTLKSGKSTLVNALVGECIAPTDATEATRLVTWFRHGAVPKATANHVDGRRSNVPIIRAAAGEGGLTFDVGASRPDDVVDIDVEWPAPALSDATIVDTPGTSSLTQGVSERTLRLLVPPDGVPRVDAVVFLLRTLNAADIALLTQIGELVGGPSGALGVIGVASRADEIGAGRIDAMLSAKDVAQRFTRELERTGICQAVVPVSGLLALTAQTLRQSEFDALSKLAAVDAAELNKAMLSADRFVRDDPGNPVDGATRAALLDRLGMFGESRWRCCVPESPTRPPWPRTCWTAADCQPCGTRSTSISRSVPTCSSHTPRWWLCAGSSNCTAAPRRRESSPTSSYCWPTPMLLKSCACSANCVRGQAPSTTRRWRHCAGSSAARVPTRPVGSA